MPNKPERCVTCKFRRRGTCHRYPPKFMNSTSAQLSGIEKDEGTWPRVMGNEWCGEYQADPASFPQFFELEETNGCGSQTS